MYLTLSKLRGKSADMSINYGRPKKDDCSDLTAKSERNQWTMVWIRWLWGPMNIDTDPAGSQYFGALNVMRLDEPFPQMVVAWNSSYMSMKYAKFSCTCSASNVR